MNNQKTFDDIRKIFAECKGRVALYTHKNPDPDGLGAIKGMEWLLRKVYNLECTIFLDGPVSHPQNVAIVETLDLQFEKACDAKLEDFALFILFDAIPCGKAGTGGKAVNFNIVIDHHKKAPNGGFNGIYINLHTGSTCTMIQQIIKMHEVHFQENNEEDSKVATALSVGIIADTEGLASRDTTLLDHQAHLELFPYRNYNAFEQIVKWKRPQSWVKTKQLALLDALSRTQDNLAIAAVGVIQGGKRDILADVAEDMLNWSGIDVAVAFGFVEYDDQNDRIEGCVRSSNPTMQVSVICEQLGGEYGYGGGKMGKGAYAIPLREMSLEEDCSVEIKQATWELARIKQINSIQNTIKK